MAYLNHRVLRRVLPMLSLEIPQLPGGWLECVSPMPLQLPGGRPEFRVVKRVQACKQVAGHVTNTSLPEEWTYTYLHSGSATAYIQQQLHTAAAAYSKEKRFRICWRLPGTTRLLMHSAIL